MCQNNIRTIAFLLVCGVGIAMADEIAVRNASAKAFFASIYYINGVIERHQVPVLINPGDEIMLSRPPRKWFYDRVLVLSPAISDLKNNLSITDFVLLNHGNVGQKWGSIFYIADTSMGIAIRSQLGHGIGGLFDPLKTWLQPSVDYLRDNLSSLFRKYLPIIKNNPHKNTVAYVRLGNGLSTSEKQYLAARDTFVKEAWKKLFDKDLHRQLRIALVCSGGGYRAMLATLGFLSGLEKLGMLDLVTFVSTLSGSTWALSSWILSQKSLEQHSEYLSSRLGVHIATLSPEAALRITEPFLAKIGYNFPLSLVDLYGGMLADRLLHGLVRKSQWPLLSDQASLILNTHNNRAIASYPLPIYTAVHPETIKGYEWFEFTPFEMGSAWLPAYIPSWAIGRKFVSGRSIDDAPEASFGYLMGVYGSAFSVTLADLIRIKKVSFDEVRQPLRTLVQYAFETAQNSRPALAVIPNFMYGLFGSLQTFQLLTLVDAGIDCNLPYAPVSGQRVEREIDLVIFMDASAGLHAGAWSLDCCSSFAQRHAIPFAQLPSDIASRQAYLERVASSSLTILDTQDSGAPPMLYMPLCQARQIQPSRFMLQGMQEYREILQNFNLETCIQGGPCNTFNFTYTPSEAMAVVKQMEFNVISNKELLLSVLEQVAH